jgi:hypothetical protein
MIDHVAIDHDNDDDDEDGGDNVALCFSFFLCVCHMNIVALTKWRCLLAAFVSHNQSREMSRDELKYVLCWHFD